MDIQVLPHPGLTRDFIVEEATPLFRLPEVNAEAILFLSHIAVNKAFALV
jgi:hypothetical protein